jgi:DNA phosphorothioation-associated DGQHR protein 1
MKIYQSISILHPLGEFYLTALPVELLLKVCFSDPYIRQKSEESGRVQDRGHQRRLDPNRLADISRYLQTQDAALPGTIILAANCTTDGEILSVEDDNKKTRWQIEQNGNNMVNIIILTFEKLAAIVDGQHRLWGFERAIKENEDLKNICLPCAIFLDLPAPQQASIFATINFNQKPVSKSQTYELFGYNLDEEPQHSWSPDKFAVFCSRKLNVDEDSPFKDHIKVAAQDDRVLDKISIQRQKDWSVSTATIVEGIISLISKNAKQDRDALHKLNLNMRLRRTLKNIPSRGEQPPFRDLYLSEERDIVIYKTLINFFSAADELLWQGLSMESKSLIRKTAGIQALFRVLKELLPEQLKEKDSQKSTWLKILHNAQNIDFSNINIFESSGRGRKRIQDAILVAIGKKSLDSVSDSQFHDYLSDIMT